MSAVTHSGARERPGLGAGRMRELLAALYWNPYSLADALDVDQRQVRRWLSTSSTDRSHRVPINVAAWLEQIVVSYSVRLDWVPQPDELGQTANFVVPDDLINPMKLAYWTRHNLLFVVRYPDRLAWSRIAPIESCSPAIAHYIRAMAMELAAVLRAHPAPDDWGRLPAFEDEIMPEPNTLLRQQPANNPLTDLLGDDAWEHDAAEQHDH